MSDSAFAYSPSPYRYVARFRDGAWEEGFLSDDPNIVLNESACVLQYAQNVFEGLKARRTSDGRIITFRPDMNAARLKESCRRMAMPEYPEDLFLRAVDDVVRANADVIPPYGDGSSFYLRPFMIGTDPVLGVKPATEYEFRIFGSPVGKYFSRMIKLRVCDLDRVAPHGTGHVKAGLNYAMSLYAITEAHALGYDENLYLDAATRTYVEETGGANIFFITKDGKLVTPRSDTILPSITRDSVIKVASSYLGIEAEERPIAMDEIADFAECGLCGTAAVISPVESIDDHGSILTYFRGIPQEESVTQRIKNVLTEIQQGDRPAPEGWIREVRLDN
ncbi:MAG: branched-chain amino acid aminotransferase [Oscillospiraceae bacterium]|nr:branched-chain amino acid aminotransferase [Oscillospiraceae bacterium]